MEQAHLEKTQEFVLANLDQTRDLATRLAGIARPGLSVYLEGPVGAGKTELARATIQTLLARYDRVEDVPSPTFTLVQTYLAGDLEIWHADLYRLADPNELVEIGLEDALETAFCLIEWPDRMPPDMSDSDHLHISLHPGLADDSRRAMLSGDEQTLRMLQGGL